MGDALALIGEEGRDKLRKGTVRSKYPLTRASPNGTTRCIEDASFRLTSESERRELKHLSTCRKRK